MSAFEEWVRTVLDARLLAERHKDPLLLPLIDTLEKAGEAFKNEPEYEAVMKILEEARKLLDSTTTTTTPTTTSTTSTTSNVLLEAVASGGGVTVPSTVVREYGLRPGEAIIKLEVNGRVVQYRTVLYRTNRKATTMRFYIPINIRKKYGITDGTRVKVISIAQEGPGRYIVRRGRVVYIPAETARRLGVKPGPALVRIEVGKSIIEFTTRLYKGGGGDSPAVKLLIPSSIAHQYGIRPGSEVVIHSIRNL